MSAKVKSQCNGNPLELNEIGTGQQVPHDFDWTEA